MYEATVSLFRLTLDQLQDDGRVSCIYEENRGNTTVFTWRDTLGEIRMATFE